MNNMVKLKFIIKDGMLVLRISEKKERYYKSVRHLLIGQPNLKYWMKEHERFSSHAPSCAKNNKILEDYKNVYRKLMFEYPEFSARQIASFYGHINKTSDFDLMYNHVKIYDSVEEFMNTVIEREKMKPGENYLKYKYLLTKCKRLIPQFSSLTFQSIRYETCAKIAQLFANDSGYIGAVNYFRAFLFKADKDQHVKFSMSQIGDFNFKRYIPKTYKGHQIPIVLSEEQLTDFLNINIEEFTTEKFNMEAVELFYDFSCFLLHSFLAPCDAVYLHESNITNRNTIQIKRRKTFKQAEIPISDRMLKIIAKYKGLSPYGYIFPIVDDKKEILHKKYQYQMKKFRERLNLWLHSVGEKLGFNFRLHSYIFRRTAISLAINNGLPVAYVSSLSGTQAENIQKYYYNGYNRSNLEKLKEIFDEKI